ncbi:hypothetical protein tinsulaeT_34840 [Thalassotalea insulae]|uniref:RNA-binding S4 domain-containing protein n=1 Tax=Thalassotalea insulae TaxID=2056778 RepID=A0ABQ6GWU8_9GAMM|nr:RNA-binding S4 domain-containing protein [Thalassotalea insulae]GLX80144.1 hypothetical protein tinsulaeT_34840 [Thalassotalea insulae]
MNNTISVELENQPIELCKLLKVANLVNGGGEAKIVISEGYVAVNGEIALQKRRKIYHQDVVEFNGDFIEVICHTPLETPKAKPEKKKAPLSTNKASANKKTTASGKRKKISF